MSKNSEPLSDHPLFRALVLMGGGLALSCGGLARTDHDASAGGASAEPGGASGSSGAGAESGGATTIVITQPEPVDAGPPPLDCPTEQYDCGVLEQSYCGFNVNNALALGACVCNPARPISVKDCKPNENIVCYQGYLPGPQIQTWDGSVHVQCSCIPSHVPATYEDCQPACAQAFPGVTGTSCMLPPQCTYDASNNCTATATDVLYQDGIMCGCANIGLK